MIKLTGAITKTPIFIKKSSITYMERQDDKTEMQIESSNNSVYVIETPEEIMRMSDIDWEQRRYEIAKDITSASCIRPGVLCTSRITDLADVLVAELKKKQYYVM